ncbi:MAG TPA: hypothetical protein VHC22_06940 [Pirellulales bacterium]|nr:hypothetical protein [Pirellulales bacterium]
MSDSPSGPNDNAERAALDEAWAAFSHLLDASQPDVAQNLLVRQVCGRLGRRTARSRRMAVVLALAASVALVVGLVSWRRVAPHREIARAPQGRESTAATAGFDWDDELADEIESAAWSLGAVQSEVHGRFERARWVQEEMDELESEIELSSL